MSTSKKHREFVSEPMGDKKTSAVPGIGPRTEERLSGQGYKEASQLFGQFLVNQEQFTGFLQEKAGSNRHHATSASNGMNEWKNQHL